MIKNIEKRKKKWEDEEPTLIQDILDRYEVIENEKI